MQNPAVSGIIFGARTIEQLEDNLRSMSFSLTEEDMRTLSKASESPLPYPYEYIARFNTRIW